MKKFFSFVLIACMTVFVTTFTSCEKKANEADYPIVGHTFVGSDAGGTAQMLFRDDFTVVITVMPAATRAVYDWKMKNNVIDICLQEAMYFPIFDETHPKGWVAFSGPYDPVAKTITMKDSFVGDVLVYHQAD